MAQDRFRRDMCAPLIAIALTGSAPTGSAVASAAPADTLHQVMRPQGVQLAYDRLLDVLHHVPEKASRPTRARIAGAAHALQAAIRADGNARGSLVDDAKNIVGSLSDGSFSASRSIGALKRDARGNVVEAGRWRPDAISGSRVAGPIGDKMRQAGLGDCVGVSVLKAFSTAPIGEEILRSSVRKESDGGFNVTFAGDPSKVFRISAGSLAQFGKGDAAGSAVIGAMFAYFGIDPKHGALPTNKAMALLSMGFGRHQRLWDRKASPREIESYLRRNASHVGRDVAMVFGGKPINKTGDWSRGDGHAFAVLHIDAQAGTITYTNPWNDTREHTMPIAALARQAAGTGADFETVSFDPRAMTPDKRASTQIVPRGDPA